MPLFRKCIKIRASDSPNVRLAEQQIAAGQLPTNEIIVPGVVSYADYLRRRATWDKVRQCIGLDAEFYEGASVLLYPPMWLNKAEEVARDLTLRKVKRQAATMGCDAAEGGDNTSWTVIDRLGIIYKENAKTIDTSVIVPRTIALIREYGLKPEDVLFDRGGGGKQHVDLLRSRGYNVRAVAFGEAATTSEGRDLAAIKSGVKIREEKEARYVYKNRRAEMYGILRYNLLACTEDPDTGALTPVNDKGFGIPAEYTELRRQLAPIPLLYDEEGRIFLPPKQRKPGSDSKQLTMYDLIGCSPDDGDSLVLATFGLFNRVEKRVVGAY